MIENVLTRNKASVRTKITVKTLISVGIVALAITLPQLLHLAVGAQAGVKWLPMYLPVLLGGCLLGSGWGVGIGLISPLISYLITSSVGSPMPALARLPFMMAELAVFALIAGLFSKQIVKKSWMAFPAVLLAELGGRAFFLLAVAVFQNVTPFNTVMIWGQIKIGFAGILLQAAVVPLLVMGLSRILKEEKNND